MMCAAFPIIVTYVHYDSVDVHAVPREPMPCKVASVLGMPRMVANTAPRNEGILQLLHGGPIVYSATTDVILSPLGNLADFDRISTNIAILIRATC